MTIRIVLFGRQGAGKGTQAGRLSEHFGAPHISTGEMLRDAVAEGSEVGQRVKAIVDAGQLVSDELMLDVIQDRLEHDDVQRGGFILDGFPRTLAQAEALVDLTPFDLAVNIEVPYEVVVERMQSRGRSDDHPEAITARLNTYETQTLMALAFLSSKGLVVDVDGIGEPDEVFERLVKAIEARLGPA